MYKKILFIFSAVIYGILILKYPDDQTLLALIPLFTTIISLLKLKSEKFDFNVSLKNEPESKIGVILYIHNSTIDAYHIHKIIIGRLPEEIITDKIIQPKSDKYINLSIDGPLPLKFRNVKVKLYVYLNANNKLIKYSKKKTSNPNFELTATKWYNLKNKISEVFKL
jgi:hypothetical protein